MNDELKDYTAPLGAFQFISPGDAFVTFACLIAYAYLLSPWLK